MLTNQLVRLRKRVSRALSTSCWVSGMTAKLNFVSVTAISIRAYAMCTLRSHAAELKSLTNWILTLCVPAASAGPTG